MNGKELLKSYANGKRDFCEADLQGVNLAGANLRWANLRWANLAEANLTEANLRWANLAGANLAGANLARANLARANLAGANLIGADLQGANLASADLTGAILAKANLTRTDLTKANLNKANLQDADLTGADLAGADLAEVALCWASLSGAKDLLIASEWLQKNFAADEEGLIVYKTFGTFYAPPMRWDIRAGGVLTEVVSPCRISDCGCGINFATLDWIRTELYGTGAIIWKCRIPWRYLADVVVPYNTDGKARCGYLELIEPLETVVEE